MQFTPGQLRTAASISPERYRNWKKALVPLQRKRGHSPCFTSGDLVAAAVIRTLCVDLGIRVGRLSQIAISLFDVCNEFSWPVLERGKMIFDISNEKVRFQSEAANKIGEGALVIVPLRLIIGRLREQLIAVEGLEEQLGLRFPPSELTAPSMYATLRERL